MYKFTKRLLDIILAGLALVILSPLLIIIVLILLFTGEHEVFYLQKRVGYQNKIFYIWKFATMVKNSPNMGTGEITLRDDPRVMPFGKFLRMSKLNEIPQVMNVLLGDMSIVGPRPLMPVSFNLYNDEVKQKIYASKPGMTGIGSLVFRDEEKILSLASDPKIMYQKIYPYKGKLEIWYLQNASLWVDIKIIFLTAWTILFPGNKLTPHFFNNLPARDF